MNFYWVNLGASVFEAKDGNFLWCPTQTTKKNGEVFTPKHWDIVQHVKTGDLLFGYFDKHIVLVAQAKTDAFEAPTPGTRKSAASPKNGYQVDITWYPSEAQIHSKEVLSVFGTNLVDSDASSLFDSKGNIRRIYMTRLQRDVGLRLLGMTHLTSLFVDALVDEVLPDEPINPTTREAIIAARVGQGKFRQGLIKHWDGQCAVTSLRSPDLLIASHIKPWEIANNAERLDSANGLLLSPNLDKLFDKNLISFDDDGKIMLSPALDAADRKALGVNAGMKLRISPSKKQRSFLAWHRQRLIKAN